MVHLIALETATRTSAVAPSLEDAAIAIDHTRDRVLEAEVVSASVVREFVVRLKTPSTLPVAVSLLVSLVQLLVDLLVDNLARDISSATSS